MSETPGPDTLKNGRKQKVLQALRDGCTRRAASAVAGIDHATFYRWLKEDATLCDAVTEAEAEAERRMTASVLAAATGAEGVSQDWRAAAWWMERRLPEYANRETLTLMHRMARDVAGMTNEQLAELTGQAAAAAEEPAEGE